MLPCYFELMSGMRLRSPPKQVIALPISAWTMPDRAPYKAEQEKASKNL